jgi:hypothetical protein
VHDGWIATHQLPHHLHHSSLNPLLDNLAYHQSLRDKQPGTATITLAKGDGEDLQDPFDIAGQSIKTKQDDLQTLGASFDLVEQTVNK